MRARRHNISLYFNEIILKLSLSDPIPLELVPSSSCAEEEAGPREMATSLVLDNGAYSLKVGLASEQEPKYVPNCITRYIEIQHIQMNFP